MDEPTKAAVWPSVEGESMFVADPAYQTWQYRMFMQAIRKEPGAVWADFRLLCDALGITAMQEVMA